MSDIINEWFSYTEAEKEAIRMLKARKTLFHRRLLTALLIFLFFTMLLIVITPLYIFPRYTNLLIDGWILNNFFSWFIFPIITIAGVYLSLYILTVDKTGKKRFRPIYNEKSYNWSEKYIYRPGISLGFRVDNSEEIFISDDEFDRHLAIVGTTGSGKTSFLMSIIYQQIMRGGGLLFIEGKSVSRMRDCFINMVKQSGRIDQLRIFLPAVPNLSHRYNPIDIENLYRTTEKLMRLLPPVSESSEAKHYHDIIKNTLYLSLKVLKNTGRMYNYKDIYALLEYPEISMEYMKRLLQGSGKDLVDLEKLFLQYKTDITFQRQIKGITSQLMGIATMDDVSDVLCSDYTDINIYDAMVGNQIVYIALPTMEASKLAEQYGRIILADIITSIGTIFRERTALSLPFYIIMDEFASYATAEYSRVYEQARGAKIRIVAAFQTISSMADEQKGLSEEFLDATVGNCYLVSLRAGDPTTGMWLSKAFGERDTFTMDLRGVDTHSEHSTLFDIESKISPHTSVSSNYAVGTKQTEKYYVLPGELLNLPKGQAYTNIGSKEPYKVYTSYINVEELAPSNYIGDYDIPRWNKIPGKVLNLSQYVDEVLRRQGQREDFVLYATKVKSPQEQKKTDESGKIKQSSEKKEGLKSDYSQSQKDKANKTTATAKKNVKDVENSHKDTKKIISGSIETKKSTENNIETEKTSNTRMSIWQKYNRK